MASNLKSTELSIDVPLYNEEKNLGYLFERLTSTLNKITSSYEIVCVNDGSKDNTLGIIGEYLGRVYEEVKGRPLYLVRESYGFEPQKQERETILN